MRINPLAITLRSKKLGVLLQDARLAAGKSVEECAQAIGVSVSIFEAYEYGESSPSLPELEVLAYFLGVPLDHFWGMTAISESNSKNGEIDLHKLVGLRQRIIGTLVRQARTNANLELEVVAEAMGLTASQLDAYEMGEAPIPLPVLEQLGDYLYHPIREFQDQKGPLGSKIAEQRAVQGFLVLPADLQVFICKPVNRPYLELATRLSEMSVEKLRAVAEGLLEITL
jgi:transcriptional regulator with XRE-family HTH domain